MGSEERLDTEHVACEARHSNLADFGKTVQRGLGRRYPLSPENIRGRPRRRRKRGWTDRTSEFI